MKKVLIAFIALTAAAALWVALDPGNGPETPRIPGASSSAVTWEWLSLMLPGGFDEQDGSVRWRGSLDGQTIDAGRATLRSAPDPSDELQVRAKFAAQEFFGNLTFGLPADQLRAPDPDFTWLKLRANFNLKSPLALTPWLSLAGKLGLDADAGGGKAIPVAATIKLTGRDPQFIAALPDMSGQLASATFDSFTANATLDAHAVEITEFVATGTGIRVTGGGHLNLAPSYEESSIDFTLEVARSNATTQPVLAQTYAGLAQTNSYQVGLHGSL
ncbi:MAG: hypothetical protein KDH09_20270, partial [Chrysiogenetes bacterium]|nr:hypothetical protein [Chrysiogenetes bacterium]